jgi:hypothetical protein
VGFRSSCGTMRRGQVLILISTRVVGPAAGEQTNCDNVIFSWVSWQRPDDTGDRARRRDESLCDALVFDQRTELFPNQSQQRRIASRRLDFCNLALRNDIFECTYRRHWRS